MVIDYIVQFSFAATGGLFLVVPLLIMVYVPGTTASVVTTCISVFYFATTLAVWSTVARFMEHADSLFARMYGLRFSGFEPKDIIAATAAYAAVLVVFVGASLASSPS
jgi:hypothetical protein